MMVSRVRPPAYLIFVRLLGQGDRQATAGIWAAVAQAHAVLALAAATAISASAADDRAGAGPTGTEPGSGRGDH